MRPICLPPNPAVAYLFPVRSFGMRGLSDSTCEARRQKVLSLVSALPEAAAEVCGGRHLSFKVRGKTFGYFLNDHHGDGRVALNCKTAPGVNDTLARVASDRFFIPKYVGARGWLGLWLDYRRSIGLRLRT